MPNRRFVLWMVGLYLVIVVPLNWLVFRAVGRVELAWLAVPVLAIAWGIVVVWLAQLDIGFARAETEVAVLEAQGGYSRGHLTRYMALYSSLSSTYDVHFDDPSALALPLALDQTVAVGEGRSDVTLETATDVQLENFMVSSNSTGMVHSEQMISLNGAFDSREPADAAPSIENNSRLALEGVAIVRRRKIDADTASTSRRRSWKRPGLDGWPRPTDGKSSSSLSTQHGPTSRRARAVARDGRKASRWDVELAAVVRAGRRSAAVGSRGRATGGMVRSRVDGRARRSGGGPGATRDPGDRQPPFRRADARARRKPATRGKTERALAFSCGRRAAPAVSRMIELIDFGKNYGDFTAVESLNLKIEAGEMFGFIGPNGAGKSTTIRFLATLLKATNGEGIVNGH